MSVDPAAGALPTVSVVIPTLHRAERLLTGLRTLLAAPALHELVVVVDGPDEPTEVALRQLDDPRVRVLVLPENGGQSAAREVGARSASGEVLLLLDDDVELDPAAVLGHARAHAAAPGLVVLGYNPVALPDRRRRGMGATYLYAQEYDRSWQLATQQPDLVLERLWAGHLSVRRSAYLGLAAALPWPAKYHEDQDLGRRFLAAGLEGRLAPELRSRHHHVRTVAQSVAEATRQGQALALLASRWPGADPPDYAVRTGPLGLRSIASRPAAARVLVPLASRAAMLAGAVGAWPVETAALRVARQTSLRLALKEASAAEPAAAPVG